MASMNQHVLFSNITIMLKVTPVYSVMWDSSLLNHNDTAKGGRELPTLNEDTICMGILPQGHTLVTY